MKKAKCPKTKFWKKNWTTIDDNITTEGFPLYMLIINKIKSFEYFSKFHEIFKKANYSRDLLMNMDETSVYEGFPSYHTYEECVGRRVIAITTGQEIIH